MVDTTAGRRVLSQSSIFGAKSKNRVSEMQRLTDCQTLEKATLRQKPFCSVEKRATGRRAEARAGVDRGAGKGLARGTGFWGQNVQSDASVQRLTRQPNLATLPS